MSPKTQAPATQAPWLGAHLGFDGRLYGPPADRVLLDDVAPLLERIHDDLRGFFFIRYTVGGPHIRLRLLPRDETRGQDLRDRVEALAERSERITGLDFVTYEPEIERYGGLDGVAVSETSFQASSELTLGLLAKIDPHDRAARLGKALLAHLVLLHALLPDRARAAELSAAFGTAYLRRLAPRPEVQQGWITELERGFDRQKDRLSDYVEAAWAALEDGDDLTPELDVFRRRMVGVRDDLAELVRRGRLRDGRGQTDWRSCVRWLLPSYLHMTSNRLGIDLKEECYLAVLVHKTLGYGLEKTSYAASNV